jgi:hypothetical protein
MTNTVKLRNACEAATLVFDKLNMDQFTELKSKLEYCIGSFDYDNNPVGLIEYGEIALKELKAFKEKNPRKVNRKILTNLEKVLQS